MHISFLDISRLELGVTAGIAKASTPVVMEDCLSHRGTDSLMQEARTEVD